MIVDERTAVDALVRVARPIILELFRPDSCLESTKIAVDSLQYFGIHARPAPCKVMLWNAAYAQAFSSGVERPINEPGAYAVGIGYYDAGWEREHAGEPGRSRKPYWGHLVAVTPSFLIDLALDQASRPQHGIEVGPRAFELDAEFMEPNGRAVYVGDDGVVIYEADHARDDYRPTWQKNAGYIRTTTGKVIRAMRTEMATVDA